MAKNHQKNPQALFDLDSALERTGGDKDFLRELLSIYEEEGQELPPRTTFTVKLWR